eukprot:9449840-Heterocapsa_arctica.AAC.1
MRSEASSLQSSGPNAACMTMMKSPLSSSDVSSWFLQMKWSLVVMAAALMAQWAPPGGQSARARTVALWTAAACSLGMSLVLMCLMAPP